MTNEDRDQASKAETSEIRNEGDEAKVQAANSQESLAYSSSSNAKSLAALREEVHSLKKKIGVSTVIALLLGSSGAFGLFKFFVERPLLEENQRLENMALLAGLDKRELEQTVMSDKKQIETIKEQLQLAQGDKAEIQRLLGKLRRANQEYSSELQRLRSELKHRRRQGDAWSQR